MSVTKEFVLAGKATFTVSNGKGDHYTFRVVKKEFNDRPIWFGQLLTGPDNTSDYTYIGVVSEDLKVRLTRKSKYTEESTPVKVLDWTLLHIFMQLPFPNGYKVQHEGRCGRCGRVLTVPESIESGIGPECAKIMAHF